MSFTEIDLENDKNIVPLTDKIDQLPNISQKYFYHFDFPNLTESGFVEICQNKIILLFPDKHNLSENTTDSHIYNKNINVFINKQIKFSYQWLPIYTFSDFQKTKDMLNRVYFEYLRFIQWLDYDNSGFECAKYYDELVTVTGAKSYTINCFENMSNISIDLELNKNKTNTLIKKIPFNLQFYIGSNLIFCIERDLGTLEYNDLCIVLSLILQKIK